MSVRTEARATLLLLLCGGVVLAGVGAWVFAESDPDSAWRELSKALIQLGVIVVLGAWVKYFFDETQETRRGEARRIEFAHEQRAIRREQRLEFLRRVRACHVRVDYAKSLIRAHGTQKTWFERSRQLMKLRPEIAEIAEDLRATDGLFGAETAEIINGLEHIHAYLGKLEAEYVKNKSAADRHAQSKQTRRLDYSIDKLRLKWVDDFRSHGKRFVEGYDDPLTSVKTRMRQQIFREIEPAGPATATAE